MLDKTLKFYTIKMQCAQIDQKDFDRVVMWSIRLRERKWTNEFGQCEATQPSDQGATNHQETNKFTNTLNFKMQ